MERVEASELVTGIGRRYIGALEVGNEPTLYGHIPWYPVAGSRVLPWYSHTGRLVFGRGAGWGPSAFAAQFAQALRVLPRGVAVAGPETGRAPWMDAFRRFVSRRSRVRILTSHAYALIECIKQPSQPGFPSVPHLLSPAASRSLTTGLAPYIALAHAAGGSYRLDELGSISCNGRAGVSDTMASALWLADALFAIARDGVDGVNLHTFPGSVNGLFDLSRAGATVHPAYYGALLFAAAAPAGSRLIPVHAANTGGLLRAWATRAGDGLLRVLLINDSLTSPCRATVTAPAGRTAAALERLAARSAYARTGVTLGGRTVGADGVLPPPAQRSLEARRGAYELTLAPASAALLVVPARTRVPNRAP